jgi:4-hydroxy-3-methylbut-2-enyl diphosphate reductase
LIHISEVSFERVNKITDVLTEGQQIEVKIIKIDYDNRKVSLSVKAAMESDQPETPEDAGPDEIVAGSDASGTVVADGLMDAETEDDA